VQVYHGTGAVGQELTGSSGGVSYGDGSRDNKRLEKETSRGEREKEMLAWAPNT